MHLHLFLLTIYIDYSHASTISSAVLSSTQKSSSFSIASRPPLLFGRPPIPPRTGNAFIRALRPLRISNRVSLKRSPLQESNALVHYTDVDLTNQVTAKNGTFYRNGTVIKASSAAGLDAIFGSSSNVGSTIVGNPTSGTTATFSAASPVTSSTPPGVNNAINPSAATLTSDKSSLSTKQTLLRYAQFSAAAYQRTCAAPLGTSLVKAFAFDASTTSTNSLSSFNGYITRDEVKKELIVTFRGDATLQIFNSATLSGLQTGLIDVTSSASYPFGAPTGSSVNSELLTAYLFGSAGLTAVLHAQLASYPDYGITFTGHGSGGGLASIAAVHHAVLLGSKTSMQVITFGAPRVGNARWAAYTESLFLTNSVAKYLRVTQVNDNIPQILASSAGYQHSSVELFLQDSTATAEMTQCTGSEDLNCNDAQLKSSNNNINNAANPTSATQSESPQNIVGLNIPQPMSTGTQAVSSISATESTTPSGASSLRTVDAQVPCSVCKGTECIICIDDNVRVKESVSGALATKSMTEDLDQISVIGGALPAYSLSSARVKSDVPVKSGSSLAPVPVPVPENNAASHTYSSITTNSTTHNSTAFMTNSSNMSSLYSIHEGIIKAFNISAMTTTQKNSTSTNVTFGINNVNAYIAAVADDYTLATNNSIGLNTTGSMYNNSETQSSTNDMAPLTAGPRTVTNAVTTPIVNSAHLTYLGINMVQDGAQYCTASNVVLTNVNLPAAAVLETPTSTTATRTYISASGSIRLELAKAALGLSLSCIYSLMNG